MEDIDKGLSLIRGGVSNTITSVGKDNLVLEQICTAPEESEI